MSEGTSEALEVVQQGGSIAAGSLDGATLGEVSLRLADDLTEERAGEIGELLGKVGRASSWWVGDYVRECQRLFGEDRGLGIACSMTGYAERTLRAWEMTAATIPEDDRSPALSFSTHIELAELYRVNPEKYRELRRELELQFAAKGQNRGHKDVRAMVRVVLDGMGVQLALAEFPTVDEELAEMRAALASTEDELQQLRLDNCLDVQCPKCSHVWATDLAKAVAAAAHEARLAGLSDGEIAAAAQAAAESALA